MKIRIKNPIWGVPITFLYSYNPEQFEIVWTSDRGGDGRLENLKVKNAIRFDAPVVNGKGLYKRIFIKKKITQIKISVKDLLV